MRDAARPSVSAIMNTRNNARMLALSIRGAWQVADEVVVTDMASEDGSRAIALSEGAKVIDIPPGPYVEPARATAAAAASGDYLLILDPDEVITAALAKTCRILLSAPLPPRAVSFVFQTFAFGGPLAHGTLGPSVERHVRLFARDAVDLRSDIHAGIRPKPEVQVLDLTRHAGYVAHYAYETIDDFVDRANRYTSVEAADLVARGEHPSRMGAVRGFLRCYLKERSFLDGGVGLDQAVLLALYRYLVASKCAALEQSGPQEAVRRGYARSAQLLMR